MKLILASSSPRRKELLKLLGIEPRIIVPTVDENRRAGESVETFLQRVTKSKGEVVYRDVFFEVPLVCADTIVLCENTIIGKPVDRADAFGPDLGSVQARIS